MAKHTHTHTHIHRCADVCSVCVCVCVCVCVYRKKQAADSWAKAKTYAVLREKEIARRERERGG